MPQSLANPIFASFWAGESLSPFEQACLHSFSLRGYEVILYTYDSLKGVPAGVRVEDARAIVEPRYMDLYLIDGRPSLSHFSDIFRYKMSEKTGCVWIDSDILLLRTIDIELPKTLLAKEHAKSLCGAVLRLDREDPRIPILIERCEDLAGQNLVWGATGPRLLTEVFGKDRLFSIAYEPKTFFPIHFDDFWKAFLPACREECEELCRDAYTVHLWNNIVVKLGILKEFMPPEGSFLENQFKRDGSDRYFSGCYPIGTMNQLVENWRRRIDGAELGVGPLVRQLIPSIRITVKKRFGRLLPK